MSDEESLFEELLGHNTLIDPQTFSFCPGEINIQFMKLRGLDIVFEQFNLMYEQYLH